MKKILLTFSAFAFAASVNAQHLTLFEEFTGENCPPCAATNPGLWDLVTTAGNESKVLLIKYQVPIPSAGPIYNAYKTDADARKNYYQSQASIFAPSSRHDGIVYPGTYPGHAGYLNQTRIDSVSALASAFDVIVTGKYNATNDSFIATVQVKAKAAYNQSGANLKLRTAFVQSLHYASAPGTNGETDFEHVVRKMMPNASGETMPNTWTVNQSQVFTVKAPIQAHIKTKDGGFFVAWIQNDADKRVLQAARSTENVFPTSVETAVNGIGDVTVYPNPANNYTTVEMSLGENADVTVNVTDMVGRSVYSTTTQKLVAGTHRMNISTEKFANGLYNITIKANDQKVVKQVVVAK